MGDPMPPLVLILTAIGSFIAVVADLFIRGDKDRGHNHD